MMRNLKRKSDALDESSEDTQTGHLLVCFSKLVRDTPHPVFYKFESYPIQKLISKSSTVELLQPEDQFLWREEMDEPDKPRPFIPTRDPTRTRTAPYCEMSFLNVGDSLYAVGGHKPVPWKLWYTPDDLPKDFCCISLSTPLQSSRVEEKCKVNHIKFAPIMVEIGGLIYVLSRSDFPMGFNLRNLFESYDPSKDEWVSLPEPGLVYTHPSLLPKVGFPYFVIEEKLYVSTGGYSCTYDTNLKEWTACELFSDFTPRRFRKVSGCGPPFPFSRRPVLFKKKFLLCCGSYCDSDYALVAAFELSDEKRVVNVPIKFGCSLEDGSSKTIDEKKAKKISFEFNRSIGDGYMDSIFYLGDDYFVGMFYEQDLDSDLIKPKEYMRMVTFKVLEENGDFGLILRGEIVSMHDRDTRDMDDGDGYKWLDFVDAFVRP